MGQDLAKKAVPTFKKAWDRERIAMVMGDLFSFALRQPTRVMQTELCEGVTLQVGQTLQLKADADGWWLARDGQRVATLADVPHALAQRSQAGESSFPVVVTDVHCEAGIAEVKTP